MSTPITDTIIVYHLFKQNSYIIILNVNFEVNSFKYL